jgi:hypothetical protein
MPFDPDQAWGAKANHPVRGAIDGWRIRARLLPAGGGWVLTLAPKRLLGMGVAIGDEVTVELAPEGPQRGDLADDFAAALAASPAAGAFFDTLAQFYRKAYLLPDGKGLLFPVSPREQQASHGTRRPDHYPPLGTPVIRYRRGILHEFEAQHVHEEADRWVVLADHDGDKTEMHRASIGDLRRSDRTPTVG